MKANTTDQFGRPIGEVSIDSDTTTIVTASRFPITEKLLEDAVNLKLHEEVIADRVIESLNELGITEYVSKQTIEHSPLTHVFRIMAAHHLRIVRSLS